MWALKCCGSPIHECEPSRQSSKTINPLRRLLGFFEEFRLMRNDCIRIGLKCERENNATPSMKRLSLACYTPLKKYRVYSRYRLTAISRAAGILASRRKSMKRGFFTRTTYVSRPLLISCYDVDGNLKVQLGGGRHEYIPLNAHTRRILSDHTLRLNSFTLTDKILAITVSKEILTEQKRPTGVFGIERNPRNLAVGNQRKVAYYDMTKVVKIAENTRHIVKSFKRNDARVLLSISSKYGTRRSERIKQIIHAVTKQIVEDAKAENQAIAFEEIGEYVISIGREMAKGESSERG